MFSRVWNPKIVVRSAEKASKIGQKSSDSTQKRCFGHSGSGRTHRPFGLKISRGLKCTERKFRGKFQVHTTSGWLRIGRERSLPGDFSNVSYGVSRRTFGPKFGVAELWWEVTSPLKYLSLGTSIEYVRAERLFA